MEPLAACLPFPHELELLVVDQGLSLSPLEVNPTRSMYSATSLQHHLKQGAVDCRC